MNSLNASFKKSSDFQETKAIEAIKRNPKFLFSYLKKFSKIKTAIGPLLNQDGEYVSDNKEMADALASQYSSVFSTPLSNPIDPNDLFSNNNDASKLSDFQFTPEDVCLLYTSPSPRD